MSLSYPLWISRGWPYNKSFIDKACLVNIAGYIELGEYPVILTSCLVFFIQLSFEGEVNTIIYLAL